MKKSPVKAEIVAESFWAKENFLFAVRLIFQGKVFTIFCNFCPALFLANNCRMVLEGSSLFGRSLRKMTGRVIFGHAFGSMVGEEM